MSRVVDIIFQRVTYPKKVIVKGKGTHYKNRIMVYRQGLNDMVRRLKNRTGRGEDNTGIGKDRTG